MAEDGDARKVDMLVRDIYGEGEDSRPRCRTSHPCTRARSRGSWLSNAPEAQECGARRCSASRARVLLLQDRAGLQLPGDLTASFFARALSAEPKASDADLCKALVVMISQNLAQIAHLNAQVHGLRRVFFTGARRGGREGGAEGRRTSREAQGWGRWSGRSGRWRGTRRLTSPPAASRRAGNFLRGNDLAMRTIVYTLQRMPRVVVHGELGRRKRETRGPSLPPASSSRPLIRACGVPPGDLLLPVGAVVVPVAGSFR